MHDAHGSNLTKKIPPQYLTDLNAKSRNDENGTNWVVQAPPKKPFRIIFVLSFSTFSTIQNHKILRG
ncbi:MAG: hypothetical protein JNL70_03420 [Saprospiraceae bacterium]|nr:hypothetical protein [Saprospiraceae bacterium]